MENPTTYNENLQNNSIHSEICTVTESDFNYRKAYKGDWGHWDDLPETSTSNFPEMELQ